MTSAETHERAWTLPAAAALGALEATVAIAVLLYSRQRGPVALVIFLALKFPICWMVLRRQAWAYFALLLWEFSVAFIAVAWAARAPVWLRFVEFAMSMAVIGLLLASTHLFPRAQLPRHPR